MQKQLEQNNMKTIQKQKRAKRIRHNIRRVSTLPRLSVYRSNAHLAVQIIDDTLQKTILGLSEKTLGTKGTKTEKAKALGLEFAKKALSKKVKHVVFDKGMYKYHGRVKALADAVREGGLEF
ncbi:MAG TPA: 50S ribosomal protein L18 [Patescibacteria group bacterium]|nr:50S ribosomal protein L18 [Patescibacteria group bacterium]